MKMLRSGFVAAAVMAASASFAQQPAPAPQDAPRLPNDTGAAPRAPLPTLPCPANGYARPWFGAAGDNDGILRGYEVASPCIARETIAAADAIGMARGRPVGVKNVSTIRFGATGSIAGDSGAPVAYPDIDISVSYAIPALRVSVRRPGPAGTPGVSGRVFADGRAWNEAAPGMASVAAPRTAAAARAPLMRLTPFGALLSIIEAEGHATVAQENGHVVLRGTSPYDGYAVTVTLDDKSQPVAAEVKAGGRTYQAAFAGYTDKWESPYLVIFPERITWSVDGKPLADLRVVRFHSNPYVVFPTPEMLAAAK